MLVRVSLMLLICAITCATLDSYLQRGRIFTATKSGFQLDGEPFHVHAGEIHYFRIASCWWQDRLTKLRRAGFNTVSTAIEWAMHEPKPEKYLWHGNANFTRFIELAFQLNLFVIIRAGPFIGVDRDLGGLPKWLFKTDLSKTEFDFQKQIAEYRYHVKRWLSTLLPKLADKTIAFGGPIIMFQIDSDLGDGPLCHENDWLYHFFRSYLEKDTVLFTMNDNFYQTIECGHINGTLPAIRTNPLEYSRSFNSSPKHLFESLSEISPNSPKLVEIHCGTPWFWGGKRFSYDSQELESLILDLSSEESSIILYMFAGGTNFERPGASLSEPLGMISSYDYSAPISETGDPSDVYFMIKSIFNHQERRSTNTTHPLDPIPRNRALYTSLNFTCLGSFLDPDVRQNLGLVPLEDRDPRMFHEIAGVYPEMVLYETILPQHLSGVVEIHSLGIRDRGYVYVGQELVGVMNQTRHTITMNASDSAGQKVQILVESQGYRTRSVFGDRKGIASDVYLNDVALKNWTMWPLSFDDVEWWQDAVGKVKKRPLKKHGNCLYASSFMVSPNFTQPMDSILDVSMLGKGQIFLNEFSVGKFWPRMGPQQYLYIPGCFIKPYPVVNRMLVFELYQRARSKKSRRKKKRPRKSERLTYDSASSKCGSALLIFLCLLFLSDRHLNL